MGQFTHLGTETRGDRRVMTYGHVESGDRLFILLRLNTDHRPFSVEVLDEDQLALVATTNESIRELPSTTDGPPAPPMSTLDPS